jgi:hypothetical protein
MSFFEYVLSLFQRNEPHPDIIELYSEINEKAHKNRDKLEKIRKLQKEIVDKKMVAKIKRGKAGPTGFLHKEKGDFLDDTIKNKEAGLIYALTKLEKESERRFFHAENLNKNRPVSEIEKQELKRILKLLKDIEKVIAGSDKIIENFLYKKENERDTLAKLNAVIAEVGKLSKDFHDSEKKQEKAAKEAVSLKLVPLVVKVHEAKGNCVRMSKEQLSDFQREAEIINSWEDPRYRVIFRRWWRKTQEPEIDLNTDLKEPHINLTVIIHGKKKEIHLIAA